MDAVVAAKGRGALGPVLLVLLVIIIAGAGFFLLGGTIGTGGHMPRIAVGFPPVSLSFVDGKGALTPIAQTVPGSLQDYVTAGEGAAAIVLSETGASEVYRVEPELVQLTDDGARKASLAISPDGKWIAYATLDEADPSLSDRLASWSVYVLPEAGGLPLLLGKGYAPQFFEKDGMLRILFSSPEGIGVGDPVEATSQVIRYEASQNIHAPILVSGDGRYIAIRDVARVYSIFEFSLLPFEVHPIRSLPSSVEGMVFSSNDRALGIVYEGEDALLMQLGLKSQEGDKELATLPPAEQLYYLLP